MARKYAKLERIDHDRVITKEQDAEFLRNLRKGVLLALRERGTINVMQYQWAEEQLKKCPAKDNFI